MTLSSGFFSYVNGSVYGKIQITRLTVVTPIGNL